MQGAVQESGWTYLSEGFIQDLERAITEGGTISSVLQEYGLNRSTYYSWLAIGEGRMTHWRDGTPISADMRTNCKRLYKRVLRAREADFKNETPGPALAEPGVAMSAVDLGVADHRRL